MSQLKYLIPLVIFITLTRPALATDTTTSASRSAKQDLKANLQTERQEFRSNIASNHATRLEGHFNQYYQRFTNLIARIQVRLTALQTAGKDTTTATAALTTAQATLESAKAKGNEAIAAFRAINPAKFNEQKSQALAARDLAESARKLFQQTQQQLKIVMVELKKLSPKPTHSPLASPTI